MSDEASYGVSVRERINEISDLMDEMRESGVSNKPEDMDEGQLFSLLCEMQKQKNELSIFLHNVSERFHGSEAVTRSSNDSVKTLHNSTVSGARKNVKDLSVVGNGDMFQLLCKASSQKEGWMKSTKAMDVGNGCLVQVTTQQRNPDGSYAVAEALSFVPGVMVVEDENNGRMLMPSD